MNRPRESSIVRGTLEALNALPGGLFRKRHGTAFGVTGDPDIYGSLNGRHVEIEVKRPGEASTPLQRKRLVAWVAAGAIAGVATSREEAVALVTGPAP